jgi:hypothetical protein
MSLDASPELADVGRLARRLMRRAVSAARAEDAPIQSLLRGHLGTSLSSLPVVSGAWPGYEHVNVQVGLDSWLAAPGRTHGLIGLTGFRHMDFGLADLMQNSRFDSDLGVGSVATAARASGPGAQSLPCVQCGLYLIDDAGTRLAILMRGPEERGAEEGVSLEAACTDPAAAQRALDEIQRLAIDGNVFRGHVISFDSEVFGHRRGALLNFLDRPQVDRAEVILPPDVLDGIERQVIGVARHSRLLRASGQHLKRGVLLHGPPGTGKTHTVRYLLGQLPGVTSVVVSGYALRFIAEACSVARTLQPSIIVIEDVDLIAEERGRHPGQHPLLFQLLNEMDGLGADADVTFLLTTNRADLLEEALAARPGRVDHAAELPIPDRDARRRLIQLYRGGLTLDLTDGETVLTRTDGVTASFLKELLRRAALVAAEQLTAGEDQASEDQASEDQAALRVTDAHLTAALDQLLDTRSQLTRILLGGRQHATAPDHPAPDYPAPDYPVPEPAPDYPAPD